MISHAPSLAVPDARRPSSRLAVWIGTAAGVFLGAVLLVAAYAKALDPAAFARQIHLDGLDFALPAAAVALAAIGLEVGLGLALVLGLRRLWVLLPAVALVAFFLLLTGRAYWQSAHGTLPEDAGCGCFGNLVERSPAEAFWQDLALLAPALGLAFLGRGRAGNGADDRGERGDRGARPFPTGRTAIVLAATAAAVLFAWKAPALPLDDLATRLSPGVRLADLCAGTGKERVCLSDVDAGLATGRCLAVIADLADPAFQKSVCALNAYAAAGQGPALRVLAASTPGEEQAFTWRFGPSFKVVEAPAALLRPLYRRLPRAFVVEDGRVVRTYAGLPPLPSIPSR
jgi:uncharacterized membrane protein YphA (DoxX/SURF4 family)